MAIPVKLEVFEGPLDLLLHLIDINKIDIYDIPIVEITDQYLTYIRQMDREDMGVTSEFLVMAATLLDIKSKMLLPREVNEEGEEEDPRDELVRKLLEYKMYKYMSQELREQNSIASLSWYRKKDLPDEVKSYVPPIDYEELIGDSTLSQLNDIFQAVLRRAEQRVDPVRSRFGNIEKEEINLDEKKNYIRNYLKLNRHTTFRSLLEKQKGKEDMIVAFLIMLELIRNGSIEIEQDHIFGEITINLTEKGMNESDEEFMAAMSGDEEGGRKEQSTDGRPETGNGGN